MQQVSLHIRIVHFVTELLAAYMVPDKLMHLAVMTGSQRWVYLPNSSMAATVRLPSGRIKRRLRISLFRSVP